ncbi:unnamed protein product, partial [Eretmochelys imbricata]
EFESEGLVVLQADDKDDRAFEAELQTSSVEEKQYEEEEEEPPVTEPNTEDEGEEEATRQVKPSEVPDVNLVANEKLQNENQSSDSSTVSSAVSQAERPPSCSKAKSPPSSSSSVPDSSVSLHYSVYSSPSSPALNSSQNSSASITPKASPTVEKLPYVPHSPFHLFSYDFEESPATVTEKEAEVIREN